MLATSSAAISPTRHHRRSARRADRIGHGELVKLGALVRQPVDIRRSDIGVAVQTDISPAKVVGKDKNDVGLCFPASARRHAEVQRADHAVPEQK